MGSPKVGDKVVFERDQLQGVLDALARKGYSAVGPVVSGGAIVYDEIGSVGDLPEGWADEQDGGTYKLTHRDGGSLFGFAVGPQSWKKYLMPPVVKLWGAKRNGKGFAIDDGAGAPRYAFVGVRACEIAAIAVHDRVFLEGPYVDPNYKARREAALIIAVNCSNPGGTCFCSSMGTGPAVTAGFDLALTEISAGGKTGFLAEVGSPRGGELLAKVASHEATAEEKRAAASVSQKAAACMGRSLDTSGLTDALAKAYESPAWDEVAGPCLTCGNCTMVCPTCFCTTVEDVNELDGGTLRQRKWDSCFTLEFSYIHGGNIRSSATSRYRQWATHKLANTQAQFGVSGCVGCGRCITWCPVGIDITASARAVRGDKAGASTKAAGKQVAKAGSKAGRAK